MTPVARHSLRSTTATICGKPLEVLEQRLGIETAADDGELLVHVAPAPGIAGDLAADSSAIPSSKSRARFSSSPPRARPLLSCERRDQLGLRLRPDSGHACKPSLRRGLAELLGGANAESAPDLDRTLGAETDEPPEPDELGRHLALQLVELGDPPRLEELAEPRLDPRADAAQLADATGLHELGDRRLRLADQLGSPPVGARCRGSLREVEQGRERLEPVRDLRVRCAVPLGHGNSVPMELVSVDEFEHGLGWHLEGEQLSAPRMRSGSEEASG